jgi:outer membrane protein OmpA-like peptidoglycan-associated protein
MWEEVLLSPVKLTKVIYFNSASGKITPAALRQLRAFVNSVKGVDVVTNISIYGYVQPTANNKADKALSTARAKNTASALKKLGIGKINDAVGMGKAINKSAAKSRYVRIVVRGFNDVTPR